MIRANNNTINFREYVESLFRTQLNSEIENTGVRVPGSVMTGQKKELPAWLERFF